MVSGLRRLSFIDFWYQIQELKLLDIHDGHGLMRRRLLNDRLLLAERSFLHADGLQGRTWYKHLVSKPCANYATRVPKKGKFFIVFHGT
jgi:N-acetylated-alpha-linked acidic dipeptidase